MITELATGINCPACNKEIVIDDVLDLGFIHRAKSQPALLEACKEALYAINNRYKTRYKESGTLYYINLTKSLKAAIEKAEKS